MPAIRSGSLFGRLLLLFTLVPIIELALLVWMGGRIGFWPTVGLIAVTALIGTLLAQREGVAAWTRFQSRIAAGELPGKELTDGILILISGALLLTPGVLTDVVGLLGLLPPSRALIRRQLTKRLRSRATVGFSSFSPFSAPPPSVQPPPPPPKQKDIIDVSFEDLPPPSGRTR
jgi:UPF0716 protein FxsA